MALAAWVDYNGDRQARGQVGQIPPSALTRATGFVVEPHAVWATNDSWVSLGNRFRIREPRISDGVRDDFNPVIDRGHARPPWHPRVRTAFGMLSGAAAGSADHRVSRPANPHGGVLFWGLRGSDVSVNRCALRPSRALQHAPSARLAVTRALNGFNRLDRVHHAAGAGVLLRRRLLAPLRGVVGGEKSHDDAASRPHRHEVVGQWPVSTVLRAVDAVLYLTAPLPARCPRTC